ncbi:MAG: hypothetical protein KDB18_04080 [Salinibacterium sp.]|nr:hypothetical protein [Salinibacterium sp.]
MQETLAVMSLCQAAAELAVKAIIPSAMATALSTAMNFDRIWISPWDNNKQLCFRVLLHRRVCA